MRGCRCTACSRHRRRARGAVLALEAEEEVPVEEALVVLSTWEGPCGCQGGVAAVGDRAVVDDDDEPAGGRSEIRAVRAR